MVLEPPRQLRPLPRNFYEPSAATVAPQLLGHWLIRNTTAGPCGGVIVETEAYLPNDPASHAFNGETKRNRVMFGPPGHGYVYFIYGNHWCFNAVCRPAGHAEAVLVRALEPAFGLDALRRRRHVARELDLTNGPGKLCAALDIRGSHDGVDLCDAESPVFIARNPGLAKTLKPLGPLITTTRIGITRAADLPLRFYLDGSKFVSRRSNNPKVS